MLSIYYKNTYNANMEMYKIPNYFQMIIRSWMKVFQMMKQNEKKCQKMTQKIATIQQCVATCNLVCYNNPSRVMDETSLVQEGKPNVNLWAIGRNILAHGFISIFVPKKKRSKKKNDKPLMGTTSSYKTKRIWLQTKILTE